MIAFEFTGSWQMQMNGIVRLHENAHEVVYGEIKDLML